MEYSKEELKEFMFKEIEIIQDIIRRMAFNSFLIKGWTITLVAVALLLRGTKYQVFIAYIPLLCFWALDAYFLWLERYYRKLYEWVVENRLKTDKYLFALKVDKDRFKDLRDKDSGDFKDFKHAILKVMFSWSLGVFYGSILGVTLLYTIVLYVIN